MQGCKSFISPRWTVALVLGLLPAAGCVQSEKELSKIQTTGPVHQVFSYWNNEVMQDQPGAVGGKNLPGLAGRVYLFGPKVKYPVVAQGDAKILVEMTYQRPGNKTQTLQYEFPKHYLDQLLSRDLVGWGYTIPLPWEVYQPGVKEVTLKVAYCPEKGNAVISSPSTIVLHSAGMVQGIARQIPIGPNASAPAPKGS